MNKTIALVVVSFALACSGPPGPFGPAGATGPQGPAGPQGPKGDPSSGGSGSAMEFATFEDPIVSEGTASYIASFASVSLAGKGGLPASSRTIYVQVSACAKPIAQPFILKVKSPLSPVTHEVFVDNPCSTGDLDTAGQLSVWLPVDSSQTIQVGFETYGSSNAWAEATSLTAGWIR